MRAQDGGNPRLSTVATVIVAGPEGTGTPTEPVRFNVSGIVTVTIQDTAPTGYFIHQFFAVDQNNNVSIKT